MKLPDFCYSLMDGRVVVISRGAREPTPLPILNPDHVEILNHKNGVTEEQRLAMEAGVTFGWQHPAALVGSKTELYEVTLPVLLTTQVRANSAEHAIEVANLTLPEGFTPDGLASAEVVKI